MTIPETHPEDERLSALAGADPDAAGDAALRVHVSGCDRCAAVLDDLSRLRAMLATLPDVAPPRPLRLLPATFDREPSFTERAADVVRRVFAPVLAAGAAVALVGAVGTAADVGLLGMPGGAATGGPPAGAGAAQERVAQEDVGAGVEAAATEAAAAEPYGGDPPTDASPGEAGDRDFSVMAAEESPIPAGDQLALPDGGEQERSVWPMVLFTGVALIIGALLLRWILQPRAG